LSTYKELSVIWDGCRNSHTFAAVLAYIKSDG
jgi:hypothetical protein